MRPYVFSFRLSGITIRAEPSWLFLVLLVAWSLAAGFFPDAAAGLSTSTYIVMAVASAMGLSVSVLLHELSHTFVGRAFGLPIRHVTLFIFGGAAELEEEPDRAMVELVMAIAGPAMSVLLGLVFLALSPALGAAGIGTAVTAVIDYLALINFVLAIFNMIPAFPLDGGRVFRAIAWLVTGDRLTATRIASYLGEGFAWVLILAGAALALFAGMTGAIWWALIGFFLNSAARASRFEAEARVALSGVTAGELIAPGTETAEPEMSVRRFIDERLVRHHSDWFPVVDAEGSIVGGAGVNEARAVPVADRAAMPVSRIVVKPEAGALAGADERADRAFIRMRRNGLPRLYVTRDSRFAGVLTLGDLAEFVRLKALFDRVG